MIAEGRALLAVVLTAFLMALVTLTRARSAGEGIARL